MRCPLAVFDRLLGSWWVAKLSGLNDRGQLACRHGHDLVDLSAQIIIICLLIIVLLGGIAGCIILLVDLRLKVQSAIEGVILLVVVILRSLVILCDVGSPDRLMNLSSMVLPFALTFTLGLPWKGR